ncbi:hypothetical protein RUM43_004288 [Polyplax serrata]|uniref:Uncharacterized protein n=1 Tax=Polyplax serrata TaxID=468196 RepID=A0AAN8SAV8_POLSC
MEFDSLPVKLVFVHTPMETTPASSPRTIVLVFSSPELECSEAISQGFSPLKEQTVAESQVEILLDLQVTHADLIDVAWH